MMKELEKIQEFLEITISEDVNEVINRGNDLSVYIARTGKMMADAKQILSKKMNSEITEALRKVGKEMPMMTNTGLNKLINSLCADEQYILDWAERLNRTSTHQLDWCRTLVSKAKQDQYYTNGINNQRNDR